MSYEHVTLALVVFGLVMLCLLWVGAVLGEPPVRYTVYLPIVANGALEMGPVDVAALLKAGHELGEQGRCVEAVRCYDWALAELGHQTDDLGWIEADVMVRYGLSETDLVDGCGRWRVLDQYVKWLAEQGEL
jgi:hypothetical protein